MAHGTRWIIAMAFAGMGMLAVSAQAAITIKVAEEQGGVAYIKGHEATLGAEILWEGYVVTTANNNNGGFSFFSVLPDDCSGTLEVVSVDDEGVDSSESVEVAVLGCTPVTAGIPAPVPETGQTLCYDPSGIVIDCSGTGQDGELQKGVPWPNPRFTINVNVVDDDGGTSGVVDNGICDGDEVCNGTVTDHLTGLIWLQDADCAGDIRTWATALNDVANLNTNGIMNGNDCSDYSNAGSHQTDWRLPNLRELQSLVDYGTYGPSLPAGHPFMNFVASPYWSSTSNANSPFLAWNVNFFNGNVYTYDKSGSLYVIAVRGGS